MDYWCSTAVDRTVFVFFFLDRLGSNKFILLTIFSRRSASETAYLHPVAPRETEMPLKTLYRTTYSLHYSEKTGRHATDLSPRALRRKRSGTAGEQPFPGGQEHLDVVVTVVHALAFHEAQLDFFLGGRPSGSLDHFQIVQVQTVYVVSVRRRRRNKNKRNEIVVGGGKKKKKILYDNI